MMVLVIVVVDCYAGVSADLMSVVYGVFVVRGVVFFWVGFSGFLWCSL